MRKLVLAAVAAGIMSIVAIAIAAAHDDHSSGQWPTSCVDLNDIVEAHLGNDHNVGIYQRTFGDQAEAACQNDHRNDVRSVFAWAIHEPTPEPVVVSGRGNSVSDQFTLAKGRYVVTASWSNNLLSPGSGRNFISRIIAVNGEIQESFFCSDKAILTNVIQASGSVQITIDVCSDVATLYMQVESASANVDWTFSISRVGG